MKRRWRTAAGSWSAAISALLALRTRLGLTILIIEHVMSALNRISDVITVLHHGQRIAHGTPEAIAADPMVLDAYFGADDDIAEDRE